MKKMKWIGIAIIALGLLLSVVLGTNILAEEKRVYISDSTLRASVIEAIPLDEEGELPVIENELPTVSQLEAIETLSSSEITSFEGIQSAKNLKRLVYNPSQAGGNEVIDFRPIASLENLEEFFVYGFGPESQVSKTPFDLTPFGELKNLKFLNIGYNASIFDFTPLSNATSLEFFRSYGIANVELPAVFVDRETKSFAMPHPVRYSEQFDGDRSLEVYSDFPVEYQLVGNEITISAIDESVTSLSVSLGASSKDNSFGANTTFSLPIIWR